KVKRAKAFKSHILNSQRKDTKRKRNLRHATYADKTNMEKLTKLLPYA
ncbi:MAG: 50S ribosomal protein L35, partial [Oscillospiraceae bacterium]|nr:50S ribosomal protein L35 [Oscillospiraceae bacterium]